ncbi:uncharacterized protein BDV17DRAFT_253834 [Aspergillus undulatus]|uniref:uncharacterized protein n=1 Tax=Aspergillus undulatus TaxID=1810928 RepID=UPI003CCE1B62
MYHGNFHSATLQLSTLAWAQTTPTVTIIPSQTHSRLRVNYVDGSKTPAKYLLACSLAPYGSLSSAIPFAHSPTFPSLPNPITTLNTLQTTKKSALLTRHRSQTEALPARCTITLSRAVSSQN